MRSAGQVGALIRGAISWIIARRVTPYVVLILISLALLFPVYWMLVTSVTPTGDIFRWPPSIVPQTVTLEHYRTALGNVQITMNIGNSVIYALAVALFCVTIGTLTAYGFAFFPYRGSTTVQLMFVATRIVPPQALWLPFVVLLVKLGLSNARLPVILYEIALAYPLAIWMLKGSFDAFPRDLIDSAAIDGASRLVTLIRIVTPIAAPAIAAVAIISFLWTWNEFMFPFLVLNDPALYPITVGIFNFVGDEGIKWGPISATGILTLVPTAVFFLLAQRQIVEGLTKGALKE